MSTTTNTIGDGRYALDRLVSARTGGGLWRADDLRLGRAVLLQRDDGGWRGPSAHDLAVTVSAAVPPVLDADDAARTADVYAVYPECDWPTLGDALTHGRVTADDAPAIAAWLVATRDLLGSACGTTVALDIGSVLVDPRGTEECPVRWMPAPGARTDHFADVLAELATLVPRWRRRRWHTTVDELSRSLRRPTGHRMPTGTRPVTHETEMACVSV